MATITGGNKLQSVLQKIATSASKASSVEIGWPADGSTYPDGTLIAAVAALNEFGHGTTPPRPFFRNMIAAHSSEWPEAIGATLKTTDYDAAKTLGLTGQAITNQLQQSINDFTSPPLSSRTVERKGSDKPLIDSGDMFKEVKFVVR